MATEQDAQPPSVEDLEALSTEQLRERAFAEAEHRHDLGFFWDLVKHLRAGRDMAADDGSAGGLGDSITGVIELVNELAGNHQAHELEPLLRARYITYLRSPRA